MQGESQHTGKSINYIVKALKGVTDTRILNTLSDEEIIMRSEIKEGTKRLLSQTDVLR